MLRDPTYPPEGVCMVWCALLVLSPWRCPSIYRARARGAAGPTHMTPYGVHVEATTLYQLRGMRHRPRAAGARALPMAECVCAPLHLRTGWCAVHHLTEGVRRPPYGGYKGGHNGSPLWPAGGHILRLVSVTGHYAYTLPLRGAYMTPYQTTYHHIPAYPGTHPVGAAGGLTPPSPRM